MQLDAIVLAGGDPEKDAELLAHAGGAPRKTLIRLGDKTFLEHVVSAILGAGQVRAFDWRRMRTLQEELGPAAVWPGTALFKGQPTR